ncbi:MAG: hypothetical protein AUK54_01360 [Helicobacteraceae bacterium CG2_30_36_10]|nr:MAG: hypothetical protein AUK54_01360 [Helicobacteraceae bacterium CG2_30_36_10]
MITPVTLTTNNVSKELMQIARQNNISVSELYINIRSVETFLKDSNLDSESDLVEIHAKDFDKYRQEVSLRDNTIEFEQEYTIEIKFKEEAYPFKSMITEIEFEDNDTCAYLVIKKGSRLHYYKELYNDFLSFITEQKIRSNLMLYLFDVDYKSTIKQFVDVIEKVKSITFKEDKKILVSQGLKEIESVTSEIFMAIEKNNPTGDEDNEGRVNYSNRGFLLSCSAGEELFEFTKPQQGQHGRTCKGKIIEVELIDLDTKPVFTVENNIEVQESFENIKYLSSKSGYLVKTGDQYGVSNSIDVDEISFRTTGTINTDLDSEISINVIKNNPLEDAVEEGMHVKVQNLCIQGSIGPKTQIQTRNLSITGQSHHESSIKCVNANIGLHRGKAVGRKIEVTTLDGGEIIADIAIVKNCLRGKIRAKTIEIGTLGSHVVMEASQYIQIEKVKGEENTFIIDPLITGAFDNREDDEAYLSKLKDELALLVEAFKSSTEQVKKNLEPCKRIQKAIIASKNKGVEISSTLIEKFKSCRVMQVRYKKLKENVAYKKSQCEGLEKKIFNNDSNIFDAKIVLNEPINGYNHIIYKLNKPHIEINLTTDESMKKKIFKLIRDEEDILKIVNIS